MAFALGGIPILGWEGDPPEERRWLDEFQADLGLAGILLANESHRAGELFHRPGIDDGELLPSREFRRKPYHTAVRIHRSGVRFFGEGYLPVLSADDHGHYDLYAV